MVYFIGKWIMVLVFMANGSRVMIRDDPGEFRAASPDTGYVSEPFAISRSPDDIMGVYTYKPTYSAMSQLYWFGVYPNGELWYQEFLPAQGLPLERPQISAIDNEIRICGYRSHYGRQQVICWTSNGDNWGVTMRMVEPRLFIPVVMNLVNEE